MDALNQPHDKYFRVTFGEVSFATDFLNNYLPKDILDIMNMDTLEPQKESYLDKEIKEQFTDLLFRVNINNKEGYVYFLFEHKSYKDRMVIFQVLKYMVEIWESKVKDEKSDSLPIIIPLVIYHGREKWNIRTTLGEMIEGYENLEDDIKVFIPNYEYLLYDISRYKDEDIKGIAQIRIILTIFRDIFIKDKEGIKQTIILAGKYLRELEDKETAVEYFETFLRYVFSVGKSFDQEDIIEIIKEVERTYPEGSDLIMTTAERLRQEGLKEGLKKGKKEGRQETLLKTSTRLLTKKFGVLSNDILEKIEKLQTDTLEVLIDDIFLYESLDDLNKYLR